MPRAILILCLSPLMLNAFQCLGDGLSKFSFTVMKGTDRVGTLWVEQKIEKHRTTYILTSDVNVDFMFSIRVNENITDVFEEGALVSSSHQRYINGVLKVDHSVRRSDHGYRVVDHSERIKELADSIHDSVLSLYFNEPTQEPWVYSQNFKRMLKVREVSRHCYAIDLPNGTTTKYTYENEILTAVESNTYIGTVRFVRDH
jgi:hypothetical protein